MLTKKTFPIPVLYIYYILQNFLLKPFHDIFNVLKSLETK